MKKISIAQARNLAIHQQLLFQKSPGRNRGRLLEAIRQIGYVQIDTISVIARAHHHVLWSRIPAYRPDWLSQLEEERNIFEYWAHAASYLPIEDFRYSLIMKETYLNGTSPMLRYFKIDQQTKEYIFDRIRGEGPLMSKDFKNPDRSKKTTKGMDWTVNPLNLALRLLFMEGRIMVSHRKGFQKAYDLTDRVLPDSVDRSMPNREEFIRYLIRRDVRAHGIVRASEIGYLLKGTGKDVESLLTKMLDAGEILEVEVEKAPGKPYYTTPPLFHASLGLSSKRGMKILSPFDNLVIQRKRARELFNFDYILECYVPAAKRKFGYFCLPLLKGNRLVGQIDLKADRKHRILRIKNLIWTESIKTPEKQFSELYKSLEKFRVFNQCDSVKSEAGVHYQHH